MTPRAVRPARAIAWAAGLSAARLAFMGACACRADIDDMRCDYPGSAGPCSGYQEPHFRRGSGSDGGFRKAGGALDLTAPSGETAAASLAVSGGRFHFCSTSLSTEVWSSTSLQT